VKPHVLRYWEAEFPQLKPVKRRGNRRYYQRGDIILIRQIKGLLYEQGYTIGGARLKMNDKSEPEVPSKTSAVDLSAVIADLESVIASM
jgi:DNA-binding transcriptional MerR regulator